jgi:hypothetical protein
MNWEAIAAISTACTALVIFVTDLVATRRGGRTLHKELTVLRCFERIGGYARNGWIDPDVVYLLRPGVLS